MPKESTAPQPSAEPMRLDRADGSAMLELYRAALGPLRRDYYLKAFTRFDAQGRTGPSWNPVAGLLTLNWLVFRGLWATALGYVGALLFSALLLLGIGRLLFHLDDTALGALAAMVLLASVAVPGLWGNAWLYGALSKKMERALVDTATQEEACEVLSANAPGMRQAGMLLATNVLIAAAIAVIATRLPDTESLPLQTSSMEQARTAAPLGTSGLAQQSAAAASAPTVAVAAASAPASPQTDAQPANADTAAPAARVSTGVVQMVGAAIPAAAPASATASAPSLTATPTPEPKPDPKPAPPPPTARAAASTPAPMPVASAPAVAPVPAAKASSAPGITSQKKDVAKQSAPAPARASSQALPASGAYLINVGLFADANNARNATAKLRDADLPVQVSTLSGTKGPRTRVRVGPFETQVEAERAAEKIRALRLDAVVINP